MSILSMPKRNGTKQTFTRDALAALCAASAAYGFPSSLVSSNSS